MQNTNSVLYQSEDFLYGYDNTPAFSSDVPTHIHNEWELLFVNKGSLSYTADGNVFDVNPGNLIISPPGVIHTLSPKGTIHYERHSLVISNNLLNKDIISQLPSEFYILDVSGNNIISDLFKKVRYYLANLQGEYLETVFHAFISELWVNIYICIQNPPSQFVASHSNAVITKAVNYIKDHIQEPLTVQQVSNALFITPTYLHQCFGKYMKVTPRQYIMVQKLQLVQQALSNNANPTEVCRKYGFRSYSTFFRNYQKVYGCKPSDRPNQSLQKIEL